MKKFLPLVLALSLCSFSSQAKQNLHRYLELQGKIFQSGLDAACSEKYLDSALIVIREIETGATDTLFSADAGSYLFRLPLGQVYLVTISRDSFLTKQLQIDTHVPLFTTGSYEMEFELSLYKAIPGLSIPLLDEPVANVTFNPKKKTFDYNRAYTDQVNRNLKKIYAAYYLHRPLPSAALKKPVSYQGSAKKEQKDRARRISSGKITH